MLPAFSHPRLLVHLPQPSDEVPRHTPLSAFLSLCLEESVPHDQEHTSEMLSVDSTWEGARRIQLLPKSGRQSCLLEGFFFVFVFYRINSYLTKLEYMVSSVHYEAMYDALSVT